MNCIGRADRVVSKEQLSNTSPKKKKGTHQACIAEREIPSSVVRCMLFETVVGRE